MFEEAGLDTMMRIAGGGIVVWLLIRGRMKRRQKTQALKIQNMKFNGTAQVKPEVFTGTKSLGANADTLKWQVELNDLGREIKGELDSKMLAVASLMRRSDQASNRLGELIKLAEDVRPHADSTYAKVRQLAAAGWKAEKIGRILGMPASDVALLLEPTDGPVTN
ncbi:MAG TPA: hypothetical protein DDW52_01995 [Planctomycetaceae bacterium]|nr:hypothetical protein [Planctomycetaceae bacterium]